MNEIFFEKDTRNRGIQVREIAPRRFRITDWTRYCRDNTSYHHDEAYEVSLVEMKRIAGDYQD